MVEDGILEARVELRGSRGGHHRISTGCRETGQPLADREELHNLSPTPCAQPKRGHPRWQFNARRLNQVSLTGSALQMAYLSRLANDLDSRGRSREPAVGTEPAAATELPFEFSLTGGERGIILEALDALNAIGVQDEEFPSAIRAFACFTADEPTVALEEPDYLQSLLIRSVARLPVRPTYPAEPSSNPRPEHDRP